jgi:hypothetical protein
MEITGKTPQKGAAMMMLMCIGRKPLAAGSAPDIQSQFRCSSNS